MALIKCPACANPVSREALACPQCGHVLKKSAPKSEQVTNLAAVGLLVGVLFVLLLAAVAYVFTDSALLGLGIVVGGVGFLFYLTTRGR